MSPSTGKGKGKGRADALVCKFTDSSRLASPPPSAAKPRVLPVTPPLRSQPAVATPAISFNISIGKNTKASLSTHLPTPSSKRKSQSRITSFFPSKKLRIETIPIAFTSAETKAAQKAQKELDDDISALIRDIEKEEREEEKARKEAQREQERQTRNADKDAARQSKREADAAAKLALDRLRKQKAQNRRLWKDWVTSNSRPNATFRGLRHGWDQEHRNVTQCRRDFGLSRVELDCLEHFSMRNPINEEYADMRIYRLNDVEQLAARKQAMLQGVQESD